MFLGKDADDMFEDIGHSSEARQKMKEFLVGTFKVKISNHLFGHFEIFCFISAGRSKRS